MDVLADEWSVKNNNWFSLFTLRYQRERTTMADVKWGHPQPSYITHIISLSLSPHQSPGPVKLSYESLMMWVWWWWPGTDQKLHNGQESHDPSNLRFLDCRMGSIMEGPIKRGNTSDHCTAPTHHYTPQRDSLFLPALYYELNGSLSKLCPGWDELSLWAGDSRVECGCLGVNCSN